MGLTIPLQAFAGSTDLILLSKEKDPINTLAVSPYKLNDNEKAAEFLKDKDQADIYTYRTNYKVQKGEKYKKNYQPYVASVGAAISEEDKARVKKIIKLPDLTGYIKPKDSFSINYDEIKRKAEEGDIKREDGVNIHQGEQDFKYKAKKAQVKVKHVFQTLRDLNKYANKDGSENAFTREQTGSTGSTMEVKPLDETEREGFEPEAKFIMTQVPEDTKDFELEYRYNRAYNDVVFDCADGTPIPARTLYYEQKIPKIAEGDMPTKAGMILKGWKPSVDLKGNINGKDTVFKKDEIMKDTLGKPSLNLDLNLQMPAKKVTFTAQWETKKEADYTVLFWAEKADHPKDAKLLDKYDFVGTHVYKDQKVGMRPELEKEPVKGVEFTDLDAGRLKRIYAGEKVKVNNPNGTDKMEIPYLNKFYVYNQDLTNKQNADSKNPSLIKTVSATGETVYNIYYDRQVYKLWFTKGLFNRSFYPTLTRNGEVLGKPGAPYHFEARFNQSLLGLWPNDILEVTGFEEGYNSVGWSILQDVRYNRNYRDTPPYRLTANQFVDYPELSTKGLAKEIPMGEGVAAKKAGPFDIAFGIDQGKSSNVMPIHEDFLLDGFEEDEQNYDYDLYMVKSDVDNSDYDFTQPDLQGFTRKCKSKKLDKKLDDYDLQEEMNEERNDITPFPELYYRYKGKKRQKGKMYFMYAFPKINSLNEEEKEDLKKPIEDLEEDENEYDSSVANFEQNGYLVFEYSRNKYEIKLNNDPSKEKEASSYTDKDKIQVFYDYPLKKLNLDKDHKPKKPKGIPDSWEFKGWAMDTKGQKLVWKNNETMPARNLVLYAQWGEPDYKWKVTFDANGGTLSNINTDNLTVEKKSIKEGDIGQEKEVTYPLAGEKDGDKQVFTVVQHQILNLPEKPNRKGYEFRGWELIRYKKDKDGNYTDELDTDYSQAYRKASGGPELYAFGNDVVSPIYLKAIWVPTDTVDVKVKHYFLDENFNLDKSISKNPLKEDVVDKRVNYLAATIGDQQNEEWILATDEELMAHKDSDVYKEYKDYNDRVKLNNTYFQTIRVEAENVVDQKTGVSSKNPNFENNIFKFFYRRYKTRKYKVNYVDVRAKEAIEKATDPAEKERLIRENSIIGQEKVTSECRDFDARNYRPIPGWVLAKDEKPQKQLFYDIDEETNKFLGINGSGSDEINFYYQDARVIECQNPKEPVPDGYVKVTFKASDGGSFGRDLKGNEVKEINYYVIKGLKFGLLSVPDLLKAGENISDKHHIRPDLGREFTGWDTSLLNKNTPIEEDHTFTAKFDWSEIEARCFATTESFMDPNDKWTNSFAPKISDIMSLVTWSGKDSGTIASLEFVDENGRALTDEKLFDLCSEKNMSDKDELVRTVKIRALVQFGTSEDKKVIEIPIKLYKNIYEANTSGDKPLFLTEAEKTDLNINYVKVTVNPTRKANNKDSKIYYVNPKAWVSIPEFDINNGENEPKLSKWLSGSQNDEVFDFKARHQFTQDTTITAQFDDQKPNIPEKPDDPGTTEKPDKPDTPDVPGTTEKPDKPDKPNKPENQDPSDKPNEPENPENPSKPSGSDDDKPEPGPRQKPEDPDDSGPEFPLNPGDDNPQDPEDSNPGSQFRPSEEDFGYPDNSRHWYPEVNSEAFFQEKFARKPIPSSDNSYSKEVIYIKGFNGSFRPKDGLTRAEAAQILANALIEDGYKYHDDFKISYKDIGEGWYTRAIKIVTEARVFTGYDDGNFNPQKKITRNEWISCLKRFQELSNASGNHMNLKAGHWAMGDVEAACEEGWLKIYEEGKLKYEGDKFITREEVVAICNKAFNRLVDKDYIERNAKDLINFNDVNESMWSYDDILCASNTFLYQGNIIKAHLNKDSKNSFSMDTSGFEIKQVKFERIPR
ncbi:S-layer homology domain-containing protein [Peptoniphilus sp. Marseille-Q6390]